MKWFEVVGKDGAGLRQFYGDLFGWQFNDAPGPMDYGMVDAGDGIGGGVGSTPEGPGHATFYVEVDDVKGSLEKAESAGGKSVFGPTEVPNGPEIGMFADPEGHIVGVFKPPAGAGSA